MIKHPRIIYFIKGAVLSEDDTRNALKLGSNVVFRNACFVSPEAGCEPCDGVAGHVPAHYKNLPDGYAVMEKFKAAIEAGEIKPLNAAVAGGPIPTPRPAAPAPAPLPVAPISTSPAPLAAGGPVSPPLPAPLPTVGTGS